MRSIRSVRPRALRLSQLTRYNHASTRFVHACRRERMIAAVTITIHAIELVGICVLVLLGLLVLAWRRI